MLRLQLRAPAGFGAVIVLVAVAGPANVRGQRPPQPAACVEWDAARHQRQGPDVVELGRACAAARRAQNQADAAARREQRQAEAAAAAQAAAAPPPQTAPPPRFEPMACPAPPATTSAAARMKNRDSKRVSDPDATPPTPDLAGMRLGMTVDDAVAVCCASGRRLTATHVGLNARFQEIDPQLSRDPLVEPAHLGALACSGADGTVQMKLSYPPAAPRIVQIDYTSTSPAVLREDTSAQVRKYGNIAGQVGPFPLDRQAQTARQLFAWKFPKSASDAYCMLVDVRQTAGDVFQPALPPSGACADSLVVDYKIVGGRGSEVHYQLLNARSFAQAYDDHIAFLNKTYHAGLREHAITQALTRLPPPNAPAAPPAEDASNRPIANGMFDKDADPLTTFGLILGVADATLGSMSPQDRALAVCRMNCKCADSFEQSRCKSRCEKDPHGMTSCY